MYIICIYIYIYIYTHTHTHTHIHLYELKAQSPDLGGTRFAQGGCGPFANRNPLESKPLKSWFVPVSVK